MRWLGGGNPDKPVETGAGKWRISPRRSFDKWVEHRQAYSRAWDPEIKISALRLREVLTRAGRVEGQ